MSILLICFIDKEGIPDHSFVRGMLSLALPSSSDTKVLLFTSQNLHRVVSRYNNSVLLSCLPKGDGLFGKIYRSLYIWVITKAILKKYRSRYSKTVIFVRNDPISLNVIAFLRKRFDGYIFQSSYPLELTHNSKFKRFLHTFAYRFGCRAVSALVAVSPKALDRVSAFTEHPCVKFHIPLLPDLPVLSRNHETTFPVRFLYLGSHKKIRRLNVVLEAAVDALERGANARFRFVGGHVEEYQALRDIPRVRYWEESGSIKFEAPVARTSIPSVLADSDVGICALPLDPLFVEASPTKLVEYMASGMAVLATEGIPLQEDFMRKARCGVLCRFSRLELSNAILYMAEDLSAVSNWKQNAAFYTQGNLSYDHYISKFEVAFSNIGVNRE